jgi:hypothetical protein
MQKIATKIFIIASVVFGIVGIMIAVTAPAQDSLRTPFDLGLMKMLMITVFVILPSFALSVAGKYFK